MKLLREDSAISDPPLNQAMLKLTIYRRNPSTSSSVLPQYSNNETVSELHWSSFLICGSIIMTLISQCGRDLKGHESHFMNEDADDVRLNDLFYQGHGVSYAFLFIS
jgi:hypothetical protein